MIIDGSKSVLFLDLTNDIGSPVGIYAGNGKNVKLDLKGLIVNGTVNVAPEYGNSITNAIWNDPGVDKASVIEDVLSDLKLFSPQRSVFMTGIFLHYPPEKSA